MPASSLNSKALWADFSALCDCGGRLAGSESEQQALAFAQETLSAIGGKVRAVAVPYAGWRLEEATLALPDGTPLTSHPLLGSQSTSGAGAQAEVVDLGRGTPEDFARCAERIPDRFVLVRHEYPFSSSHIHRRRKLAWAMERGAAGFIIANLQPGSGPVCGSSGRAGGEGIPAVATDYESAARLAAAGSALLRVVGEDYEAETRILVLDLPGHEAEWVVLSAHLDGHSLAESAMDNASGVAVAIAVARACASSVGQGARGLRLCLFSAEEWALAGSRHYLDAMSADERKAIALNINLDTVAGDSQLTALTSMFPQLERFISQSGCGIGTYAPMMANSDHYNFARHGIPAMRIVAGFDRPKSNVRHILTGGDTRDKVSVDELVHAADVAGALVRQALRGDP
jgi:aminopeptidase YwaD